MPTTQPFTAAYWEKLPAIPAVLVRDYTGDDVLSREIDLGDDYDVVMITVNEDRGYVQDGLALAQAVRDQYWVLANINSADAVRFFSLASADSMFQGKMTGADRTKIMLGSSNGSDTTNKLGFDYRIRAYKFSGVRS